MNNLASYVAIVSIGATTYGALSEPTRSDLQCDAGHHGGRVRVTVGLGPGLGRVEVQGGGRAGAG